MKKLPSIAFGTWLWGTGSAGGDQWRDTRSITLKKRGTNYQDEKSNNI